MNTVVQMRGTPRSPQRRSRMLGMTLLELMAVIMVIGILGAIAIPSYRQYLMRAHRAEGKAALLQLQANQERYYLANRTYGTVAQLQTALLLSGSGGNAFSERGSYRITVVAPTANGYTGRATPEPGADFDMTDDAQCTRFEITAQGVKSATGTHAATCW